MFDPLAAGPVIPLPSTVWMGLVLLVGIGFFSNRRKSRRRDNMDA